MGSELECGSSYKALVESAKKGLISEKDIDVGSPNRNIFLLFYDWQITIDKHPYGIFLSTELRNSTSNKTQRKAAKANQ